ncbi:cortactin-binding protein 2 isoform X1 [Sardina pilchardus]|uniref:cortactin-binding protein 2 isoform X1 n=1 Tax=Sardina pilchardus TaxID=27697 RepID=UPI002E111A1B
MASEGASGEQPPPIQTLAAAIHGGVEAKCELNVDNLSKPELLTLLSIMEGELEARDLVIEALRARRKEVFLQERYGHFSMTDPFLALQRDFDGGPGDKERRPVSTNPMAILDAVMAHCRKMQERMTAQLAAAENRQKRLELEKMQLQGLEQEQRKLSAQLKDEREKNKQVVMLLVRECKQLAARAAEESQRAEELTARLDEEARAQGLLEEQLACERRRGQQMEAEMEKQLAEFDTEREQLRQRLGREEARGSELRSETDGLRRQLETLRTPGPSAAAAASAGASVITPVPAVPVQVKAKAATVSVSVGTDAASPCRTTSSQTDPMPEAPPEPHRKGPPLSIPVKPTPAASYVGMSLPKTPSVGRGLLHAGGGAQAENGGAAESHSPGPGGAAAPATPALPTGVSPRVQAARFKFQASPSEQDQNGTANQSPPSRDLSPNNRDNFAAKQQARHTVTQVLSRFTSPPAGGGGGGGGGPGSGGGGGGGSMRPGLPHSASEGGPFPGRLGHPQIGLKAPSASGRVDRGNPPPIPPKKPGLSQTPSPPHPPIKVVSDGGTSRSPGMLPGKPGAPTPQLPPKPALELGGAVPALTASQVGAPCAGWPASACSGECPPATINTTSTSTTSTSTSTTSAAIVRSPSIIPTSAPPRSPRDLGSPLATASGWCPSIVPPLTCGDPVALDDGPTHLLQAASQGNVTLLSMLLNRDPTTDMCHLQQDRNSALFSAARNGHTDCVKLLLSSGASADVPDKNGFLPLHTAAAHGHHECVEVLACCTTDPDHAAVAGESPLYLASESGSVECVRILLEAGADRTHTTADSCTALHAAVSSGHVATLQLLLCHPGAKQRRDHPPPHTHPHQPPHPHSLATLLNQTNRDGWTAAHIAAARGFKDCLGVLCAQSQQDIETRDKCNRTIHDVATDDCKDLLENLYSYRVAVQVHTGLSERLCPLDLLEDGPVVGMVTVQRHTPWEELGKSLNDLLTNHLQLLCKGWDHWEDAVMTDAPLGLSPDSMASVTIGDTIWFPGEDLALSPWDLIRKRLSQRITIRLRGLSESVLDEMAFHSLMPLQLLQNYTRLVEQYRNVIFHGLEGSCQEYIATQISHCIKCRQEAVGVDCDVVRVEVDESLSKTHLLETFINCGFLVPAREPCVGGRVVVLLEGLERAPSLSELLGDLCEALENRGAVCSISPQHGQDGLYYFQEGAFLIGSLAKPRLQGSELHLQQHFRWVQLRWDSEPLHGLLGRHLRRKLLNKTQGQPWAPDDPLQRSLSWVCLVWHQLNTCLSRLGTPEALLGPRIFLSCPVVPDQAQAIVKWLARLWNAVVVPRVEDAVVSRVTAKRAPAQRRSPSNSKSLSPGQRAVLRAALSILLNKAVLQSCPLPRTEIDRHLAEFQGGTFPLSAIGISCKKGGRKGRDSGPWRRANTSPRKKGSPSTGWSSSGSLREGSLSGSEVHLMSHMNSPRISAGDPAGLSLCSDDETDLLRELQTMCSSKSEPDISKIANSKEDFIVFPGSTHGHRQLNNNNSSITEPAVQSRAPATSKDVPTVRPSVAHATDSRHSKSVPAPATGSASTPTVTATATVTPLTPQGERRATRPKSQLPVPSSRGPQRAHSSTPRAVSSSSSSVPPHPHGQSAASPRPPNKAHASSRARQALPTTNNNPPTTTTNNNNNNTLSQSHEEIWILHPNLHENYNNQG